MPNPLKLRQGKAGAQLVVPEDGPIEAVFTIKLAEALLDLPPMTADGSLSVGAIIRRLTASSRRSFDSIVKLDRRLADKYASMKDQFAAIANPSEPRWKLRLEDIVEELFVDCAPVMVIVFTADGERLVSPYKDHYNSLLSFEEFEITYGRTVRDHVRYVATTRMAALKRALTLIDADQPLEYDLDVCSENMALYTRKVKVFGEDQIHLFAERQKISIMNTTHITTKKD